MRVLWERCFFAGGRLEVVLHEDGAYRLAWDDAVVYADGARWLLGRRSPYQFRSVEQLRYDFEQDVRALGGRLG